MTVGIARGELVIRIGIETLAFCTDECSEFYNSEKDRSDVKVTDPDEWAKDVVRELEREEEDGSSPLTDLLERAMSDAVDQGSTAVELAADEPEDDDE
ncbi:MAG: hypothetical protein IMZ69_09100 [Spirochaetes bacterium]|nr:hypothetical protein [Spirochaetota bacterium]